MQSMSSGTPSAQRSQWEILQALKAGDDLALKEFYQKNYGKIERYVLTNSGSEEEAKDIYQEAFIAVWRNIQLDKFQPENETALDGYLYQIARYKWLDHLRKAKNKTIPLEDADLRDFEPEELTVEENDYTERVRENFQLLGDNCKELLSLFYFRKESMREIAKHFSWTEATARNNKWRCIEKLKKLVTSK